MAVRSSGVLVGAVVGAGDILIFQHYTAKAVDIRAMKPFDLHIEKTERSALYAAIAFTTVAAILARSHEVFIIGGLVTIAADLAIKHANTVNPDGSKGSPMESGIAESYPMPDYTA